MAQLHDLRLRLLVQQESERIIDSLPDGLDLSVIQARCLCWLALLAEAHEDSANDAVADGDVDQAMAWFADSMRLRDVIQVVSSIEIPIPGAADDPGVGDGPGGSDEGFSAGGGFDPCDDDDSLAA
ncbi:MAG: hypothetical protein RLZZ124_89 [Cyanobacteriota bacterium]|jgi:hypothetical protein